MGLFGKNLSLRFSSRANNVMNTTLLIFLIVPTAYILICNAIRIPIKCYSGPKVKSSFINNACWQHHNFSNVPNGYTPTNGYFAKGASMDINLVKAFPVVLIVVICFLIVSRMAYATIMGSVNVKTDLLIKATTYKDVRTAKKIFESLGDIATSEVGGVKHNKWSSTSSIFIADCFLSLLNLLCFVSMQVIIELTRADFQYNTYDGKKAVFPIVGAFRVAIPHRDGMVRPVTFCTFTMSALYNFLFESLDAISLAFLIIVIISFIIQLMYFLLITINKKNHKMTYNEFQVRRFVEANVGYFVLDPAVNCVKKTTPIRGLDNPCYTPSISSVTERTPIKNEV